MGLRFKRAKRVSWSKREDGTASVELALTAPLLIFMVMAAYNLAEAGQKKALVARAAMEGGRLAVVSGNQHGAIDQYVKRIMKNADPGIDTGRIRTRVNNSNTVMVSNLIIKPIEVTVEYRMPVLASFDWSPEIILKKSYTYEQWDNGIIFDVP